MSAIINVDKKKREDAHYRYKMPSIECKVESGGNGVKVVFSNLSDIAAALRRPADSLLKYLGVSRGAQTTFDAKDNKYYMMGNHLTSELQDVVFDFIEKFVLCKHCRNPETQVMPGNRTVKMRCGACGKDTCLDTLDEKIVKELVKGSSLTKSETTAKAETTVTYSDDIVPVLLDLSLDYAIPGETTTAKCPFSSLNEALKELKSLGKVGVQKRLLSIKSEHGIKEEDVPRLIFRGATFAGVDGPFIGALREAAFLFKNQLETCRSASDKVSSIQDTILSEVVLCVVNKGKAAKVPMLLKMFVDEAVLEPSKIIEFAKGIETNGQIRAKDAIPTLSAQLKVLTLWLMDGVAVETEAAPVEAAEEPEAAKSKKAKN